jgi:hypothetical protein
MTIIVCHPIQISHSALRAIDAKRVAYLNKVAVDHRRQPHETLIEHALDMERSQSVIVGTKSGEANGSVTGFGGNPCQDLSFNVMGNAIHKDADVRNQGERRALEGYFKLMGFEMVPHRRYECERKKEDKKKKKKLRTQTVKTMQQLSIK